jgi:hypothetical protein
MVDKTDQEVRANLLQSFFHLASITQTVAENRCLEDKQSIAEEWEALIDEIMSLEDICRQATQVVLQTESLGNSRCRLQRLAASYDEKIRLCEEKLDRLLSRYKQGSLVCKISADFDSD